MRCFQYLGKTHIISGNSCLGQDSRFGNAAKVFGGCMDWAKIVGNVGGDQYKQRIDALKAQGKDTSSIESTVNAALASYSGAKDSFVIYGEPQSGKTEMMIALNARLLDEGCDVVINLLTDSVDLLSQSLNRFREAGLSPSPKQFTELPTDAATLKGKQWVIFSKKNARDLEKLTETLRFMKKLVIIDDEADYASPNSKINQNEKTKINQLIHKLIGTKGRYIGVTATPARLDLNNTFSNNTERWVHFKPHANYVGQDFFFPEDGALTYRLHEFDADHGNERTELRDAILHFLCGVAEQHQHNYEKNFTMLVHTSGKTDEHNADVKVVEDTIATLSDPKDSKFAKLVKLLLETIAPVYNSSSPESIVEFVLRNINKNQIVVVNSKGKKGNNVSGLLNPTSLFSFGVGGNIISRGVTFDNLLSMYFTRAVKGSFNQDTYIQRARMFGSRQAYKDFFQLWIPRTLMQDWTKCFAFHKLAVTAVTSGKGAPVWLAEDRITPTASASIDKSSVDFAGGEMSFGLFKFDQAKLDSMMLQAGVTGSQKLQTLRQELGEDNFPDYVANYIAASLAQDDDSVCFHKASEFGVRGSYTDEEIQNIRRKKGIFSTNEFKRGDKPNARHHLKIFFNNKGKARLFYKIKGAGVRFIQNRGS
jgi:hypothetical protein